MDAVSKPKEPRPLSSGPMKTTTPVKRAKWIASRYRVASGARFRLADFDPGDTIDLGRDDQKVAKQVLVEGIEMLSNLQEKLYAQDRWAVLLIFQALDAAGKDSTIKHVMTGVNPLGCEVHPFKAPTSHELDHDFLWRCNRVLPERGKIGIFNRSYYEEVLVVRVHEEILERQKLPPGLVTKHIWKQRYEDIAAFERYLARNGVLILKFFLNVSKDEQKKRFLERIAKPEKNWKFSAEDVRERAHFSDYQRAYEDAIRHTAAPYAPWYVVPADRKWFTHVVVSSAIVECMSSLDLAFPRLRKEERKELEAAKALLLES
jgi:PPK2 family polyphosphate:nucleotide phosphotransferase